MKKYNVLVTGVGAIIGYGIIKSLHECHRNVHIIGIDVYQDAVGQAWCDEFIQAIPANDSNYISWLTALILEKKVDLVFLGIEPELYRVYDADLPLELKRKFVLNSDETIKIARNKWKTIEMLNQYKIPCIASRKEGDYAFLKRALGEKFLLKPVSGGASKGIVSIENQEDLDYCTRKTEGEYFFQQIIGTDEYEYTIGTFGLGNGELAKTKIILQRRLSRDGSTVKAKHVENKMIEEYIKTIAQVIRPIGPTNFQVRIHEGTCYLLEINPRISSSTSIRTAFGYNEAQMCLDYFLDKKEIEERQLRFGRACRYIDEVIFYEDSNLI